MSRLWDRRRRHARGAAVVDFVLVLVVLIPIVLGIMQVALVLYVRNTMASAASEGARYAATRGASPADGIRRTREQIATASSARFAQDVTASRVSLDGVPAIRVTVVAHVPALGLGGPGIEVEATGHAVLEPA